MMRPTEQLGIKYFVCCLLYGGGLMSGNGGLSSLSSSSATAFVAGPLYHRHRRHQRHARAARCAPRSFALIQSAAAAARYGPSDSVPFTSGSEWNISTTATSSNDANLKLKGDLKRLVDKILSASDPHHIPSILTNSMDLILAVTTSGGQDGVAMMRSILEETRAHRGEVAARQTEQALDLIVSFVEDFVQEAAKMEEVNKKLLGSIIMTVSDKNKSARRREEALDELLRNEKEHFTAGFLRHLEGECERIANAPKVTRESARLLEILRTIQARVLEELGAELGEAAQVLGQLIAYDDSAERIAVLEAGLTVRGVAFAHEMVQLTEQALEGFERVPKGADPELVQCVREIQTRVQDYIRTQEDPKRGFQ